ncbi:MAG: hypothetical protein QW544_02215 [Candidatus Caldarchaeum sp.]
MKIVLATAVAVALFVGVVAGAAYYTYVLGESEARYQRIVDGLRAENLRLQNLLTEATNQVNRLQADVRSLQTAVENAEQNARRLRENAESLERRLDQLSSQLSSATQDINNLRSKITRVNEILTLLENDRVLVSWIRTDPPGEREPARQYWNETRALALKSDPNLALTVDKILASLDLYFDWVDKFPPLRGTSRQEIVAWCPLYIDWLLNAPPGVEEYTNAINQFRQEVFLVVIGHIDSLSKALES